MKINVTENSVEIDNEILNDSEYRIHECEFELPESFNGLVQKAVFIWEEDTPIRMDIVDGKCDIPIEVLHDGILKIGVYAFETVNGKLKLRYSPIPDTIRVYEGSYVANAQNSEGGTPSEYEQLESRVNTALNEINEALDDVETAVDEANNLDIDVNKSGKTATVTLTKKDSTKKVVTLSDGTSLMFNWDGTRLGIKTDEDAEYTYVDLQGVQGPIGPKGEAFTIKKTYTSVAEMYADFNNMQLGDYVMIASTVEVEDNAKLYTRGETQWIFISDFSGATGIRGETGLTPNIQIGTVISGATPNVTRTGTNENPILNFTLVKGDTGATGPRGETGATGNGIATIQKTATTGLVDTYTITFTDGNTTTFNITNGEDGEVTQEQLDESQAVQDTKIDWLQTLVNQMPTVSGSGTDLSLVDVLNYRMMKLDLKGNSSQKSTSGKNLMPYPYVNTTRTKNGITFKDNGDGSITINGTATDLADFNMQYTNNQPAGSYTFITFGLPNSCYASYYSVGNVYGENVGNKTISSTTNLGMAINVPSGVTVSNVTVYPMLVSGTYTTQTIPNWEKYTGGIPAPSPSYPYPVKTVTGENSVVISNSDNTESQTYPLSLGDMEFCSSPDGTIRDAIIGTLDNWVKREYIGKVVLDGSESWTYESSSVHPFRLNISNANFKNTSNDIPPYVYSNYYKVYAWNNPPEKYGVTATSSNSNRIVFKNNDITSLNDWKSLLAINNVLLWYPHAQYVDIPITDTTLINQLNDLYDDAHSYNGTTNITTTYEDGNEQMYLDASALMDLNSLITRIQVLESEV